LRSNQPPLQRLSSGGFSGELALGNRSANFAARQSQRFEHTFVPVSWLFVELLFFARVACWLLFLAGALVNFHNRSSQLITPLTYPPVW
jgi:hypothetical protein